MERTATKDWRKYTIEDVCPSCEYINVCEMTTDCKALEILVKIREDMDCGNTDF